MSSSVTDDLSITIVDALQQRLKRNPNLPVYTFLDSKGISSVLTIEELDLTARKIAGLLLHDHSKLPPTAAVLLFETNSKAFITAYFGCLYAGVPAIPLPFPRRDYDWKRLAGVLKDANTKTVVSSLILIREPSGSRVEELPQDIDWIAIEQADRLAASTGLASPTCTAIAHIQYSSGSTGTPKGITISHRNLLHNIAYIDKDFNHTADSSIVSWLPHFHDMGLVYGILTPVVLGVRCSLLRPIDFAQDPMLWLRTISRLSATHSGAPNFAYALCASKLGSDLKEELDLGKWRVAFIGAEQIHASTIREFCDRTYTHGFHSSSLYPAYGLAEATLKVSGRRFDEHCIRSFSRTALQDGRVTTVRPDDKDAITLVSNGAVSDDMKVLIADSYCAAPLVEGRVGEILIQGPSVTPGYWNKGTDGFVWLPGVSDHSDAAWLRTGDLGFIYQSGLFIAGRLKEMIILNGCNYYPDDIEQVMEGCHSSLRGRTSAAFHVEGELAEELILVQEIERHSGAEGRNEILLALKHAIAKSFNVAPATIALVRKGAIPRTTSGKVRRSVCRDLYLTNCLKPLQIYRAKHGVSDSDALQHAPSSTSIALNAVSVTSDLLCEAGRLHRSVNPLSGNASPLAQGMDSLQLAQLSAYIYANYGLNIVNHKGWEQKTFERIAQLLIRHSKYRDEQDVYRATGSGTRGPEHIHAGTDEARLWALEALYPNCPANRICFALHINGPVDKDRLIKALQIVELSNSELRALYILKDNAVTKSFRDEIYPSSLEIADFNSQPHLQEIGRAVAARSLSLTTGHLATYLLFRKAKDDHYLIVCVHHIAFDGISTEIFRSAVIAAYKQHEAPMVLNRRHFDLRSSESPQPDANCKALDLDFWIHELASKPEGVRFPWGESKTVWFGQPATIRALRFPSDIHEALRTETLVRVATPFLTLLTLFVSSLSQWTNETTFTIVAPTSGRQTTFDWGNIGPYAHPVILPLTLQYGAPFDCTLDMMKSTFSEVMRHQSVTFAEIVRATRPRRHTNQLPYMDVMFNFIRRQTPSTLHENALSWELIPLDNGVVDCFLTMYIVESYTGEFRGWLKYPSGAHESQVERLADMFERILAETCSGDLYVSSQEESQHERPGE